MTAFLLLDFFSAPRNHFLADLCFYNHIGEALLLRRFFKSNSLNVLEKDSYMSERAKEILEVKYKSSISDMQRTASFSKSLSTKHDFSTAREILLKTLTVWFENKISFDEPIRITLGNRLSPVLQGVKTHLVVTELTDLSDKIRFTFFNEDKTRLTWTTFSLSTKVFDKTHAKFTFALQTVSDFTHDRMSPQGMENRILLRHEFNRSFKSFVSEYNKIADKVPLQNLQGA